MCKMDYVGSYFTLKGYYSNLLSHLHKVGSIARDRLKKRMVKISASKVIYIP